MAAAGQVLIVDDDPQNISRIRQALSPLGCETLSAGDGEEALAAIRRRSATHGFPGIVVTDLRMPRLDGLELLNRARSMDAELPVLLITAYGEVAVAVQAMKGGAFDFIERPFDAEILRSRITRALEQRHLVLENRRLRTELANCSGISARIIGNSPAIQALKDEVANIANTQANVLIHGETGTGKEVVARCLHEFSDRRRCRFVAINCGALTENLIESELFGHEPGAFTGATKLRLGLVEYAKGGTLFLDEIESMPVSQQAKLLRMLEERVITRLGSNEEIRVDIRLIAATKIDLLEAAAQKQFREDLVYRLNVATIHLVPLNDRREDIPLLFRHFVEELAARHRREVPALSQADIEWLMAHDWRGNVRELRNVAERLVLNIAPRTGGLAATLDGQARQHTLPEQLDAVERTLIKTALAECDSNMQRAADILGIPRRTLAEKMHRHGIAKREG